MIGLLLYCELSENKISFIMHAQTCTCDEVLVVSHITCVLYMIIPLSIRLIKTLSKHRELFLCLEALTQNGTL